MVRVVIRQTDEGPSIGDIKADLLAEYIVSYKRENDGNSPSVRQMMEGCALSTTSVVNYYLDNLERRGIIKARDYKQARHIEIVGGYMNYESG
jgi:SOS-response transcriptional repressor LexA